MSTTNVGGLAKPAVHSSAPRMSPREAAVRIHRTVAADLMETRNTRRLAKQFERICTGARAERVSTITDFGSVAETVSAAAKFTHQSRAAAHALAAAPRHLFAIAQAGSDVVRMQKEIARAKALAEVFRSPAAASAIAFMEPMVDSARSIQQQHRSMYHGYLRIADAYKGSSPSTLGRMAVAVENLMGKTTAGQKLLSSGKLLANPILLKSMTLIGGAASGIQAYHNSSSKSDEGKSVTAAMTASFVTSKELYIGARVASGTLNPLALVYDPLVKYGGQAIGLDKETAEGLTVGKWFEGSGNMYAALAETLATGDAAPLDQVHADNMVGKYGKVIQGYAMIGDTISKTPVMDKLTTDLADWWTGVPHDFRRSSTWWEAASSTAAQTASSMKEAGDGLWITIKDGFAK